MRYIYRFAIAFAVMVCSNQLVNAQIQLGVKAGANLYDNYQSGNKYFVSSPGAGFHAGVYGDYLFTGFLNDKLSARAEVLFSTRGLKLSEYTNDTRVDYERLSSYVDFPISGNYNIWNTLKLHAGVVPSLFIDEYRSITKDAEGFKVEEGDQFRSYERWQFGGFVGASYNFTVFNQNIEAGARYSMAFTRTNERIREVRASRDPKYMMLQIYVAYQLFEF